jgi:Family of unknown function (DUF6090)
MLERLRRSFADRNYASLGVELLVVIFGILIAFQIERWAEQRRDREQEYEYLLRLKEDLQIENGRLDKAFEYAQSRIEAALLLEEIVANPSLAEERPTALPVALESATWRSFPQIEAFVYSELQSSGNLALIRSESLRRKLANHYTSIRGYSRVGLDLDIQRQFERLTAGILTTDELRAIEDESWQGKQLTTAPQRAVEITQELLKRRGAIDLIPNMVQHHAFNQKVIQQTRDQAMDIIAEIDSLIEHQD